MRKVRWLLAMAVSLLCVTGCIDENQRATSAAERAMAARGGRLLETYAINERSCYSGCLTQICAGFELRDKNDRVTDVVFLRVEGVDDEGMTVMGEYRTLGECKADWFRG